MDAKLKAMVQQQKERKVGKLSESQSIEYEQGMQDQEKFHLLLREHMQKIQSRKAYFTAFGHILLSMLSAPLFTLSASLQLSLPQNIVTMQEFKRTESSSRSFQARMGHLNAKQVNMSVRFGFLNQLSGQGETRATQAVSMQKVAAMQLPFKAPVYRSYWEAIQGLYKQDIRGFYKGNGIRSVHILLFHKLNSDLNFKSEQMFP